MCCDAQELYPQREVRGFRVLRVVDAREGTKTMQRSAQLTVWDAQSFYDDFFREGQRYMVRCLVCRVSSGGRRRSDMLNGLHRRSRT